MRRWFIHTTMESYDKSNLAPLQILYLRWEQRVRSFKFQDQTWIRSFTSSLLQMHYLSAKRWDHNYVFQTVDDIQWNASHAQTYPGSEPSMACFCPQHLRLSSSSGWKFLQAQMALWSVAPSSGLYLHWPTKEGVQKGCSSKRGGPSSGRLFFIRGLTICSTISTVLSVHYTEGCFHTMGGWSLLLA